MVISQETVALLATATPDMQGTDIKSNNMAQLTIDAEISRLSEFVRTLKVRRNEMSPVSCLPPELICKIFRLVQSEWGLFHRRKSHPFGWIIITHISRRWRDIALSDPYLWSKILISGRWPEWEREFVIRSQNTPIYVGAIGLLDPRSRKAFKLLKKVLLQIHRIKGLTIDGVDGVQLSRLLSYMPPSSPILQVLEISAPSLNNDATVNSHPTFILSDDIFPNSPDLRSLSLTGYGIEWNSRLFCNLAHLDIRDLTQLSRPSYHQLLCMLKTARHLETLIIMHSLPTSNTDVLSNSEVVHLPRLIQLRTADTLASVARFIPSLSVPSTTQIMLECFTSERDIKIEMGTVMSVFGPPADNLIPHGSIRKFRHLDLVAGKELCQMSANVWGNAEPASALSGLGQPERHPDIVISLHQTGYTIDDADRLVPYALRYVPLNDLETLSLPPRTRISSYYWKYLSDSGLRNLRWLSIGETSATLLLESFLFNDHKLLPSLEHLSLDNIHFNQATSAYDMLEDMEKAFLKRREQDTPIRVLTLIETIHDSRVAKPEHIQRLERVVDRVERK